MYTIENKVIVITGGAEGIGYAIADKYLKNNAKVAVLLDINDTKGLEAVGRLTSKYGTGKAAFIHCDVTNDLEEVFSKIMNEYETVDVLVNSAGIASEVVPKVTLDINLLAVINWSLKFVKYMSKTNGKSGGTIINLASILGLLPWDETPVYCATKYGVIGFTKSLGLPIPFESTGVRVVALCPGFTSTEFSLKPGNLEELEKTEFVKNAIWQDADAVANAALDVYKTANSGSVWVIDAGNLSEFNTKDYEMIRRD